MYYITVNNKYGEYTFLQNYAKVLAYLENKDNKIENVQSFNLIICVEGKYHISQLLWNTTWFNFVKMNELFLFTEEEAIERIKNYNDSHNKDFGWTNPVMEKLKC